MLRNSFNKLFLNSARKTFENKNMGAKSFNPFTYKPQARFSSVDKFLNRLNRPLYQYIIGANIAVFVAWNSNLISKQFLYDNFTLSLNTINANRFHTFLTYSFSHISFVHLFFNMFTLYFFGRFVEQVFGPKVLLHLYLAGALTSAFFIHSSNKQYHNYFPTVGASGATAAILSFYIFNFPKQTIFLFFFPVPAWIVGILLFGQSLMMYDGRGGISGSGHLGGLVGGLFYYLFKRGKF